MFSNTKIALTAALVLSSVSGAFAYNNIGEIESPTVPSMHSVSGKAFATQHQATPAAQTVWAARSTANISNY